MRVVFDTNILISAIVFPGKRAEQAVLRVAEGKDQLVVSKPIIDELLSVLSRKFGREREDLARTALWLANLGEVVRPKRVLRVYGDEGDNRILECAVEGRATIIVTGDRAMLALGRFEDVGIISLRAYLES